MSIKLSKGGSINLQKVDNSSVESNLKKLTIGLGWDTGNSSSNWDLDACALLLVDGKLTSNSDVVSYQNKRHSSGTVYSTGDNLTGEGEGDDEQIIVNLLDVPAKYNSIVFYATIYSGKSKGQSFSEVKNAHIRAIDGNNQELLKFMISGDSSLKGKRSYVFGQVDRLENGQWEFKAIGNAYDSDNLSDIASMYKNGVSDNGNSQQPKKKLFGLF